MTKFIRGAAILVLVVAALLLAGVAQSIYLTGGIPRGMSNLDILLSAPMLVAIAISLAVLKLMKPASVAPMTVPSSTAPPSKMDTEESQGINHKIGDATVVGLNMQNMKHDVFLSCLRGASPLEALSEACQRYKLNEADRKALRDECQYVFEFDCSRFGFLSEVSDADLIRLFLMRDDVMRLHENGMSFNDAFFKVLDANPIIGGNVFFEICTNGGTKSFD